MHVSMFDVSNTVMDTIVVNINAFVAIIFVLMDTTTCSIDKTFNLNQQ